MLKRQLIIDSSIRWTFAAAAGAIVLTMSTLDDGGSGSLAIWMVAVILLWFFVGTVGARVAQQIPTITTLIEQDPAAAEQLLATAIRKHPMPRSLRLLLYHRVALLCQKRRRYDQVAALCQAVLDQRPAGALSGPLHATESTAPEPTEPDARSAFAGTVMRRHLLLMLTDARLRCHDLWGAHAGLVQLHNSHLNLSDVLQLMLVQTRYEVAAGHIRSALDRIESKVGLAELLPANQCALMHAQLAVAADQAGQTALSRWLKRRVRLLCNPGQLQTMGLVNEPVGTRFVYSPGHS